MSGSQQWIVLTACYFFVCLVGILWFREDNKKRKVKDANRETTLASIGMLVSAHSDEAGVDAEVYSATYMLLGVHVGAQAASIFVNTIEATDNNFYFPEGTFRRFCNTILDSGWTIKDLLYRGDFALKAEHCQDMVGC